MTLAHVLLLIFSINGCERPYRVPETPMPPHTVLLSQVLRELAAQPAFADNLLNRMSHEGSKQGPALLTPRLAVLLRERILGKDWQGLDRFPSWDTRELANSVELVDTYDRHAGHSNPKVSVAFAPNKYIDLGPYRLDKTQVISFDIPSAQPPFDSRALFTVVAGDLVTGAGPNALAPEHAESQRLADTLNRLAMDSFEETATAVATVAGKPVTTPQALMRALAAAGEDVVITDTRYFANFGHLVYKGQDVMAPFWLDTHIPVPHSGDASGKSRSLLVPVSHAELELHLHPHGSGPGILADISYYFGIDGKSEWRTMDTVDQPWVLKRDAHVYKGSQADEVMRLTTLLTLAYMHQHARRTDLPFGGYYPLGVCQDGVAVVERKLTGKTTLFPDTDDASLFDDPRDAEINQLFESIPKDRNDSTPDSSRIFGALPTTDFGKITIPGFGADLAALYGGWEAGKH